MRQDPEANRPRSAPSAGSEPETSLGADLLRFLRIKLARWGKALAFLVRETMILRTGWGSRAPRRRPSQWWRY